MGNQNRQHSVPVIRAKDKGLAGNITDYFVKPQPLPSKPGPKLGSKNKKSKRGRPPSQVQATDSLEGHQVVAPAVKKMKFNGAEECVTASEGKRRAYSGDKKKKELEKKGSRTDWSKGASLDK